MRAAEELRFDDRLGRSIRRALVQGVSQACPSPDARRRLLTAGALAMARRSRFVRLTGGDWLTIPHLLQATWFGRAGIANLGPLRMVQARAAIYRLGLC